MKQISRSSIKKIKDVGRDVDSGIKESMEKLAKKKINPNLTGRRKERNDQR